MDTKIEIGIVSRMATITTEVRGVMITVEQRAKFGANVLSEAEINWPGCGAQSEKFTTNFRQALIEAERIAERWNQSTGTMPEELTLESYRTRVAQEG